MPELPDVTVYVERLGALAIGQPLEAIRIASPFVLRTADPPIASAQPQMLFAPNGAMLAGSRKTPAPTMLPTTSARHFQKPSCRSSRASVTARMSQVGRAGATDPQPRIERATARWCRITGTVAAA